MKLCGECRRTPWPYVIVVFISTFTAFLTWLTLNSAGIAPDTNRWWTAGVFIGVGGMLFGYIVGCMRRHCGHDHHHPA